MPWVVELDHEWKVLCEIELMILDFFQEPLSWFGCKVGLWVLAPAGGAPDEHHVGGPLCTALLYKESSHLFHTHLMRE